VPQRLRGRLAVSVPVQGREPAQVQETVAMGDLSHAHVRRIAVPELIVGTTKPDLAELGHR
jgi:hypothetical protein